MIKEVRYKYCIDKAIDFLLENEINSFPFGCDIIIKRNKWARLKYSELAKIKNVTIRDISESFGSDDGYTIFNGRNYTIAYNDKKTYRDEPIPKRIYFTKLHEIAHIYLNHFREFNETILTRSNISSFQYDILEKEANTFAGFVIAPSIIIKHLKMNQYEVSSYFGITDTAARTNISYSKRDCNCITDEQERKLLNLFGKSMYKKTCLNCKNKFTLENAKYCPICGAKNILWGDGNMKYTQIELNEKHKARVCPECQNENTNIEGDYCQICGTHIVNKCTNPNCDVTLDGSSRFCPFCGSESTFFEDNLLLSWQQEQAKIDFSDTVQGFINAGNMPF